MAKHNETGCRGEEIAKNYLQEKNYTLLEKNWRWGRGEIDLIVRDQNILIFVEVKTRSSTYFGYPEMAVGRKKEQLMYQLAEVYCSKNNYTGEIRFDIIAILDQKGKVEIKHFEDAFFPKW